MFLKPFRIKSQTSIKGSDRKKLRSELGRQFPSVDETRWSEVIPNKEEMTVMKIYAHSGENVTVYVLQKNPAFFEVDKVVYPTVYSLWKWPDLIPCFTTWPPVFSKILGGADLMLPGVVVKEERSPHMFNRIQKLAPCSVNLVGNRAPVAVGKTAMSGEDMFLSAMRGKGVLILHSYQDLLWASGDKSEPPVIEDTEVNVTDLNEDEVNDGMEDLAENEDTKEEGSVGCEDALTEKLEEKLAITEEEGATGGVAIGEENVDDDLQMSPQEEMDRLLEHCFLCALKSRMKRADLPLTTSTFFTDYMVPFCPPDKVLDIKKSSHKKLSKFLRVMEQRQLVKVKEVSKGVDSITEYDKDHDDLRGFKMADITTRTVEVEGQQDVWSPPQVTEVFIVSAHLLPFFKLSQHKKGDALTAGDVRSAVTEYVRTEQLQCVNKSLVRLDALLSDMVVGKGEYIETLSWEELVGRFLSKLNPGYTVTFPGQNPSLHKGKLEPIQLNVAQRSGNKKVTLVTNLEVFGVDPHAFAQEVKTNMACSTSVSPLPGKNRGNEVLIQGNQITFIVKLLTGKYQIPKKFIQGAEKGKAAKKK